MKAIRKIVDRESIKSIFVPEEFGNQVEIIVMPIEDQETISSNSQYLMKLQEKTGFAAHVLGDEREDVWNDL